MSDELSQRMFPVKCTGDAPQGSLVVTVGFLEAMDEHRLARWNNLLQRTFGLLSWVGGVGSNTIAPHQTHLRLKEAASYLQDGRTVAQWIFDQAVFDPSALRILCNVIEHGSYRIGNGSELIGSPITEVLFESPNLHNITFDRLAFPKAWRNLPFDVTDYEPDSYDFNIEIWFDGQPSKPDLELVLSFVSTWQTTLDEGGFLGHPLETWRDSRDISDEGIRVTNQSIVIELRRFYADYAALDCLYNVLTRASQLHRIAEVVIGE